MLSLSPRMDLFRFVLPKDFLPKEIEEKYYKMFNNNAAVITTPIDYLNESIMGVSFPGINDVNIMQQQHGSNSIPTSNKKTLERLGKINVEPKHDIVYTGTDNPLEKIEREFKVTFRQNQGLYNYFMLYETIFYKICKPLLFPPLDVLYIDILNEGGVAIARILFYDVHIDGIEGLEFDYTKLDREAGSFQVTFKFNNVNFELIENIEV